MLVLGRVVDVFAAGVGDVAAGVGDVAVDTLRVTF